jgi:alkylation response protein AidB-like acyl-CoA dehydrogenase
MEAMAYGCPSTSAFISIHNMAAWMIDRFGRRGEGEVSPEPGPDGKMASYCLTEPSSGSDAAALKTTARARRRSLCRLNGTKQFISGGGRTRSMW